MVRKIVYTVFVCLSFFPLFGQSESGGVPVFISDMRTHIVELQTSCVRRPTKVAVGVRVTFDSDLHDIDREVHPIDVELSYIEGYLEGRRRKGASPVIYRCESEITRNRPERCIWRLCEDTIVRWMWHQPYSVIECRDYVFTENTKRWTFVVTLYLMPRK